MAIPLLLTILIFSNVISTFSASYQLSPLSAQTNFWFQNVQNKMPNPIIQKLSPLSKEKTDLFASMVSKNVKFPVDSNFCSLAKLACNSSPKNQLAAAFRYTPTTANVYQINSANKQNGTTSNADPFSFFRVSLLKNGNLVHLPHLEQSFPERTFLPSRIASKVSLSSINEIAKIFPDSETSQTKDSIQSSLSQCNAKAIQGETTSCPKSLEEMISFAKSTLSAKKLLSLTSKSTKGSNTELEIKSVRKFNTKRSVSCHEIFLPFAVYFCHSLSSTNLYEVELVERNTGAPVNTMLAICHMDTSAWPAGHVAFQILKFGPGQGEACHWFTQVDLAWINADQDFV